MPIQGYITDEELKKILSVIDTTTESGCRNMAIILLAVTTGIRACDVIRLKLTDIDWRKGEISFSQDKTDKMVSLPLLPEVGEALKQYILNFRPAVSECKEVFLRCSPPKTAITNATSIADMLILYQQKAGVERKPFDGKGFHGLRACSKSSEKNSNESKSQDLSRGRKLTLTVFPKSAEFVESTK